MPLLDHFRDPIRNDIQWGSFASAWTTLIGDQVIQSLPDEFRLDQSVKPAVRDSVDVEVASEAERKAPSPWFSEWQPPSGRAVSTICPDRFEILVHRQFGGHHLVAAIELSSKP